ncbi:hypothetical protein RHOSPDRAFT_26638 [Rhodotorula sp. JG-1b]|nr:hypothetical protein RHOSPDRAFT_26638 [Rhodotorula sp. JG-1b]
MSFSTASRSLNPTLDSGATHSLCGEISLFFNLRQCRLLPVGGVSSAKNGLLFTGGRLLIVKLVSGMIMVIHQALLVPGSAANLISSSKRNSTTTTGSRQLLDRESPFRATAW